MISTSLFCAKPETKIVLFNSPIYSESQDDKEEHLPPLGLGYIATELNRAGIPTEIVDCVYDRLGIAETVEIINRGAFDYVGFNIFSINIEIVKAILLRLNRKVHVFLGGKVAEHIYQTLLNDGIQIRSYTRRDGIANLKGQIKTTEQKQTEGLFVLKAPSIDRPIFVHSNKKQNFNSIRLMLSNSLKRFQITEMSGGYLIDSVIQQFNRTFENGVHPTIRCIALDLGGVYLNGDIDTFYNYLKEKFSIVINKRKKDRLNIDDSMMLGKITIREFLSKMIPPAKMQALDEDDWSNILLKWQSTWTPNPIMKQLVTDLSQFGYCVIPFSNLDKQNGDKYLREHYFPSCCVYYYFSYEQNHNKPARKTFIDYEMKLKTWGYNYKSFQILLIDDESANIAQARSRGWQTLQFYNDTPEAIKNLIKELKDRGILPNNYSLPESTPC